MNLRAVPTIAWVLLGLLGLTATMLMLGQREAKAFPSIASYGPSGTSALAELLRRQGYRVEQTRRLEPDVQSGDLLLRFASSEIELGDLSDFGRSDASWLSEYEQRQMQRGVRVVVLHYDSDFRRQSEIAMHSPMTVRRNDDAQQEIALQVDWAPSVFLARERLGDETAWTMPLWIGNDAAQVELFAKGGGIAIRFACATFAMNRFIDRADNAALILTTIQSLTAPGSRIVFLEGGFAGVDEPGLMESIGHWALTSWYQALLLFFVVCYSLSKPFGLPTYERQAQSGVRDLLQAVAGLLKRGRSTRLALTAAANAAEDRILSALKLPRETPSRVLQDRLPPSLVAALMEVQNRIDDKTKPETARALITTLDRELDLAFGASVRRPVRRSRLTMD